MDSLKESRPEAACAKMGDSWENQVHAFLIGRGWCPHFPCTKRAGTCELRHFGSAQQVAVACTDYHFLLEGCESGKDCEYSHHHTERQLRHGFDHYRYTFDQPIRKVHVENNGKLETKYIDNRSTELWYNGMKTFKPDAWTRLNVCPEHFYGRVVKTNKNFKSFAATAQSVQWYIDTKRDQSWNEVQADTPVEEMSCEFSCLYDHSVLPPCGSVFLLKSVSDETQLIPPEDLPLQIEPHLLEAFGGDFSMDWLPGGIELDSAQSFIDSLAKDVKEKHVDNDFLHYSLMASFATKKAAKAHLPIKEYLYQEQLEHEVVVQKREEQQIMELLKDHKAVWNMNKWKKVIEQKKEQLATSGAGKKRKCDEVSDPEPGPASVKKARPDEASAPAKRSPPVKGSAPAEAFLAAEVFPKNAPAPNPTAASAAKALPAPPAHTPTVAGKRKRSGDDDEEQQSAEPTPNKKMRPDDSAGAAIQSLFRKGTRRQFQRRTETPTKPTSTTTAKKRARGNAEPSTPAAVATTTTTKKRKRGDEEEDVRAANESGSNKKKLRVSTSGNESSDSAAASPNLSPVFSGGNSPASSASAAPSPPQLVSPKSTPATLATSKGASKDTSSALPATTNAKAAKGSSSSLPTTNCDATTGTSPIIPATTAFLPMPKCPPGVVLMSLEEYRQKISLFNKLKCDNAPAEERRRVREDIEQSLKLRGIDKPSPVARAAIYAHYKGGPEWDPC